MSHADATILEIHGELVSTYPAMPPCVRIADEPTGDFGLAHYYGVAGDGCASLSFDDAYVPHRKTIAHEFAHAMHERAGGSPFWMRADDPALVGFWAAMAYTVPLAEAIDHAIRVERERGASAAWRYYPGEHFAEAFGYVVSPDLFAAPGAMWSLYGGDLERRRADLAAFFRSLRPAATTPPVEVPDMDRETYDRWWLENMRKHVTPTDVAIKDAFNDHEHRAQTGGPVVKLGNESDL